MIFLPISSFIFWSRLWLFPSSELSPSYSACCCYSNSSACCHLHTIPSLLPTFLSFLIGRLCIGSLRALSGLLYNNLYPSICVSYPHSYHISINLYCNYQIHLLVSTCRLSFMMSGNLSITGNVASLAANTMSGT